MKDNKKKKNKLVSRIITAIVIISVILFLTLLPLLIILIPSISIIVSSKDLSKTMQKIKEEKIDKYIDSLLQSLNLEIENKKLNTGGINVGDLSPQPLDVTVCKGCNCEKKDYFLQLQDDGVHRVIKETKRMEGSEWLYNGWTVHEGRFWDVDYSKFSKRTPDDPREFLFTHKVNDFDAIYVNGTEKGGRCIISTEFPKIYSAEVGSQNPYLIDADNGHFKQDVRNKETMWLDFGEFALKCWDSRICSAFAPMVINGESGIKNAIRARQYFHKGDVWNGSENSFNAKGKATVWGDFVPKGTYIDVVFERKSDNTQVVIPFIRDDAKNVHWFDSMGQRFDQRYGQLQGRVKSVSPNGTYINKVYYYRAKLKKLTDDESEYLKWVNQKSGRGLYVVNTLNSHLKNPISASKIQEGNLIQDIKLDQTQLENMCFLGKSENGNNDCYLIFSDFQQYSVEGEERAHSDNDVIELLSFAPLEVSEFLYNIKAWNGTGMGQSKAMLLALLNGVVFDGSGALNQQVGWRLHGMRVYKDKVYSYGVNGGSFTEESKTFNTFNSLDDIAGDKVVEFCNDTCKCTICTKIAR